jgi:disulfide bond formation protein DsbB
MSIELLLLKHIEIATGCAKKLVFPVPESCSASAQLFGTIAQYHLITWMVILFFFVMLISMCFMFKK